MLQIAGSSTTPAAALSSLTSSTGFWCRDCNAVATDQCVDDEHSVCSLRKARAERAAPLLPSLQAGEAAMQGHREESWTRPRSTSAPTCPPGPRDGRHGVLALLDHRRQQLQTTTVEVDHHAIEEACKDSERNGRSPVLARGAAYLLPALGDEASELSLSLVSPSGASLTANLKAQQRPAARLLLCQLLGDGEVRRQGQDDGLPDGEALVAPAPRWTEQTNEDKEFKCDTMIARMETGVRVVRGRDWKESWMSADGEPPGRGTVTSCEESGISQVFRVEWDCGTKRSYAIRESVGCDEDKGFYPLTLVPTWPRMIFVREGAKDGAEYLDFIKISSSIHSIMAYGDLLSNASLKEVKVLEGLRCDVAPPWAKRVLQTVAHHLQSLCLIKPTADHLRVVKDMPALEVLHLSGVDAESLQLALSAPRLVALEAHCSFASPLGHLQLPGQAKLKKLVLGVYPLSAALAVVRAHAATLEHLELVAASEAPYGCPNLATELERCNLKRLRTLVLSRESDNYFCKHDASSCQEQKMQLWIMFLESGIQKAVFCSDCDKNKIQYAPALQDLPVSERAA